MSLFKAPRWVVLQITEVCNLHCKMCYEWGENGSYVHKNNLHVLPIKKIDEIFFDLQPHSPHFELFGGEPMLHPNFSNIIELVNYYNCKIDMPTNGTLLSKYAKELAESHFNGIWVSLDGPKEYNDTQRGQGVYEKAMSGLRELAFYKGSNLSTPKIGVTFIITPDNYKTLEYFFCHTLINEKLDAISLEIQLFTTQKDKEEFQKMIHNEFGIANTTMADGYLRNMEIFNGVDIHELCRQVNNVRDFYKKRGIRVLGYPKIFNPDNIKHFYNAEWIEMCEAHNNCSIPCIYAEIGADGYVTPCHTFYEIKMGNVFEKSILEIWNNKEYKKFRQQMKKRIFPICYACSRYYE